MFRREKEKIVDELAEKLSQCKIAIATDYRGITAKEMVLLRRQLRENGIEYKVTKNTLTKFASDKADKKQLEAYLTGPLALAFGYDDIVKPAKVLSEYSASSGGRLKIKGGILEDKALTPRDISRLATIPPKEVLLSQLLGQLFAPVQGLHYMLSSPLNGLVNVLQARVRQME